MGLPRWNPIRQTKAGEGRSAEEEQSERPERRESFRGTLSPTLSFPDSGCAKGTGAEPRLAP
jgi:hypothetical protein